MSGRTLLGLIAVPLGIVLVATAAAYFLAPNDLTRQIAVFGAFIALAKTIYDVADKERERRKREEEGKERVAVTIVRKPQPALKVVNKSKSLLHLAGGQFTIEKAGEEQVIPFQTVRAGRTLPAAPGSLGEEFWQFSGTATPDAPLHPGEPCIFVPSSVP